MTYAKPSIEDSERRFLVLATLLLLLISATIQAGHFCRTLIAERSASVSKTTEVTGSPFCAICASIQSAVADHGVIDTTVDRTAIQMTALPAPQIRSLFNSFDLHVRPPPIA